MIEHLIIIIFGGLRFWLMILKIKGPLHYTAPSSRWKWGQAWCLQVSLHSKKRSKWTILQGCALGGLYGPFRGLNMPLGGGMGSYLLSHITFHRPFEQCNVLRYMWSWSKQTPGLSRSPLPTLASPISPLWSVVGMSGTRLMSFMFAASPLTPRRIWLTWAPRPRNVSDLTKSRCDKSYCLTKGSLFHVHCFHMFWNKKRPNSIIIHPLTRFIVPNRTNSFNPSDFYQTLTASC